MNEFVARKGLVALKSSSFQETLFVSGSVSSPALGLLTASWALNTLTASYVASASYAVTASYVATASVVAADFNKIYASLATGSQNITVANAWQENRFNLNTNTSSYWVHPANTGQFTCSRSDIYDIELHVRAQKTGGGNQAVGVRVLKDGVEITGSYSAETLTTNNIPTDLYVNLTEPIVSGSSLLVQFAGAATTVQTISYPTFGGTPGFSHSSKILITKT